MTDAFISGSAAVPSTESWKSGTIDEVSLAKIKLPSGGYSGATTAL